MILVPASHRSDFKPKSERTGTAGDRKRNRKYKRNGNSSSGAGKSGSRSGGNFSGARRRKAN